jgi:hypothetical protein
MLRRGRYGSGAAPRNQRRTVLRPSSSLRTIALIGTPSRCRRTTSSWTSLPRRHLSQCRRSALDIGGGAGPSRLLSDDRRAAARTSALAAPNRIEQRPAAVLEQVPAVGDLHGGWRALAGAVGVGPARSRLMTSTPGRRLSQSASVSARRSGRRSTTRRPSRSTRMVP